MKDEQLSFSTIYSEGVSKTSFPVCDCGKRLPVAKQADGQHLHQCHGCLKIGGISPFYSGKGRRLKFNCADCFRQ